MPLHHSPLHPPRPLHHPAHLCTGAKPETRARNRTVLYELSEALEKSAAKKQRRQGQQPEQEARPQRRKGSEAEPARQPQQPAPQQVQPPAKQQQQQQAEEAPPPASGKKGKKRRQTEGGGGAPTGTPLQERPQRQQQQAAAAAAEAATPAAPAPGSAKKQGKMSRLRPGAADSTPAAAAGAPHEISAQEQQLLAAAVAAVTGGGTPGAASASARKKAVRFSLKRNLVNVIGQPPKPAEVRTPPTAKPKGSALKKESAFGGSAPERLLTRTGAREVDFGGRRGLAVAAGRVKRPQGTPGSRTKPVDHRRPLSPCAWPTPQVRSGWPSFKTT